MGFESGELGVSGGEGRVRAEDGRGGLHGSLHLVAQGGGWVLACGVLEDRVDFFDGG